MIGAVPVPAATLDVATAHGAAIRVRRHGNLRGNRLFVSHGNGFAVDGYAAFWGRFVADFEIVVFDMRNHGQNPQGDPAGHDYAHMADDIDRVHRAVTTEFGVKPSAGLFHSMSAQAALIAAIETGWRFDALAVFDPPNVPPDGPARQPMLDYLRRLARWARIRRADFADPDELAAEYAATRSGRDWEERTRALMARAVLRPDGGGWSLSCPPVLEASMYEQGIPLDLWPRRNRFPGPVKLIGADPERYQASPTALSNRALADAGGFDYVAIPDTSHLLQFEAPEACAEIVREFLAACGLG
jgi:pimeloyl-ACP methyl ester carboxylesterase